MKNNKAFVLAETLIVGVFVMTLMTFVYINAKPIMGIYEAQEKYNTPSAIYYSDNIRRMMVNGIHFGERRGRDPRSEITGILRTNGKYYNSPTAFCNDYIVRNVLLNGTYCNELIRIASSSESDNLIVKEIFLSSYDISNIKKTISSGKLNGMSRDLADYLLYTKTHKGEDDNNFRIFVVFKDSSIAELEVLSYV